MDDRVNGAINQEGKRLDLNGEVDLLWDGYEYADIIRTQE
jgi:hypothetical protein